MTVGHARLSTRSNANASKINDKNMAEKGRVIFQSCIKVLVEWFCKNSPGLSLSLFQIARKVRIKYDRISYSLQKRETLKTFYERGELIFCVHHCDWWCLFKRTIFFAYINDLRNVKCHFYSHSYLTHFSPDYNTNNQKIILIQQLMQFTPKNCIEIYFHA